jgi:hypothetical protein
MRRYLSSVIATLALGAACQPASSPTQQQTDAASTAEQSVAASTDTAPADVASVAQGEVDPAALSALETMSRYLGTLRDFEVRTTTSLDDVLETGQKIQFDGGAVYYVKRPDSFHIETRTDRRIRHFYYDGKTFTMYSPRMSVFAQVAAPPTITEVLQRLEDEYDISLPLNDLFHWAEAPADHGKAITSAIHVGPAKIRDTDCDQYAFRQPEVDWQIWIQRGDMPLPRKLVITTRDDPALPQYVAYLDWNLAPKFDSTTFAFTPPKDTYKIEIVKVTNTDT